MNRPNDIRLLAGEASDLPFIYRLERAYIADHEPRNVQAWHSAVHLHLEQWVRCLPRTVVAAAGDQKVGYMFWHGDATTATLASIHVETDHRRRGIGNLLLARFEEDAARSGCGVAELHVFESNPARHFYEAAGYGVAGYAAPYVVLTRTLRA